MKRVFYSPKDREEIHKRFTAYIEEWRLRLVLREWAVTLHLEKKKGDHSGPYTNCSPKYHEATIVLRLPDGLEAYWTDEDIEEGAVHELMHVLVSTWDAMWQKSHRKTLSPQILSMLLLLEEQLCDRLTVGFLRTKYPRRKAHSSPSEEQKQVSPRRRQSPQ